MYKLSLFLFANFVFSQSIKKQEENKNLILQDSVVKIVFGPRNFSKDTVFGKKGGKLVNVNEIFYSKEGEYFQNNVEKNNYNKIDTLVIKTNKAIYFQHGYHFFHHSIYKFKPGQIIKFEYINDVPFISELNNNDLEGEVNLITNYNLSKQENIDENTFFINNKRFMNTEEIFLLHSNNNKWLLSKKDTIKKWFLENKISKDLFELYTTDVENEININNKKSINLNNKMRLEIASSRFLINQSFNVLHNPELIKTNTQSYFNDKKRFNQIFFLTDIYKDNKTFLLYDTFINIMQNSDINDVELFFNKFKTIEENNFIIKAIEAKYSFNEFDVKKSKDIIFFKNNDNIKFTLDDILKKNKGNLLYVDFWASWCAPCRKLLPFSNTLQEKYKNKNISFVYISIDQELEKWKNAEAKENLNLNSNSFISMNYPNANFYKELQLKVIPRYLIFDKNGKLVNSNAPSPDSKEIIELLDKYLTE